MNVQQLHTGEHFVKDGMITGFGDAFIDAVGKTTLVLFERAVADVSDNADVTARGNNKVKLYGRAHGDVGGTSQLTATGKCEFTARGQSSVTAEGMSTGFVCDAASLVASGRSSVTMMSSGSLQVTEDASVLYAPLGKNICVQVTAAGMKALDTNLGAVQHTLRGHVDDALLRVIDDIRTDLDLGLASRALATIVFNWRAIEEHPALTKIFKDSQYCPQR